jgi:flagellar protein FliL
MAAAAEDKAEVAIAGGTSGGGPGKLVLALTAVNLMVTVGMVAILFLSFQREKHTASIEDLAANAPAQEKKEDGAAKGKEGEHGKDAGKAAVDYGKMVTLEQFIVNLSTPGSVNPKFVRVNISLEVPTEDSENEVNSKMPQVRNAIIDLFNSKRPADLTNAEGREYLKDEIRNALNGFLISGKVKGVFFTNFHLST